MTGIEIAALASAAISAGTGTASAVSAGKANKRGIKYAKEENDLQRNFQREMWNNQNWYNSPAEQMKRLKEAGINPHYYFGGSPQNQTAPVPSSGGGVAVNQKGVDFSPIAQAGQTMLQSELMKAQIDNINADTNKKNEETEGQSLSNGVTTKILANTDTDINLNNQIKGESIELTKAKVQSEKQEILNKIETNEQIKQTVNNLIASKAYTEQQTINLVSALALTKAQIITEGERQTNIRADTATKRANEQYTKQLAKTQSFVRSNLTANTAYQNASTRNLGIIGENLREENQSRKRQNYLDSKYSLNERETSWQNSREQQNVIHQSYRNLMKDEKFKELKITEQEYINMMNDITAPADGINAYKDIVNPLNGNTTTRFDSDGNYQGHSTSRRHR